MEIECIRVDSRHTINRCGEEDSILKFDFTVGSVAPLVQTKGGYGFNPLTQMVSKSLVAGYEGGDEALVNDENRRCSRCRNGNRGREPNLRR